MAARLGFGSQGRGAQAEQDRKGRQACGSETGAETRTLSSQRRFTLPEEAPIMRQIMGFLGDQARGLMRAGVSKDRICIDPGPGFDKFADEDVVIQRATRSMVSMGYPLLCAVSRKRFVGAVSGVTEATQRDAATHAICIAAITNGARILRVHDVAGTAQAINAYWAMTERDPRQGFVALGSNVGDRVGYLARATQLIEALKQECFRSTNRFMLPIPMSIGRVRLASVNQRRSGL